MALFRRDIRGGVCDRCGDSFEVEGINTALPDGWRHANVSLPSFGEGYPAAIHALLCADCVHWLEKFLQGCKVTD